MASRVQQALQFFAGLGLSPAQAAGLVGNLQQESGSGLDPTAVGDNGASFGIAQWNRPAGRLPALNAFAAERGSDASDFMTQLEFLSDELRTTEKASFDKLRAAKTPAEAALAAVSFFRPGDPQTERRVRYAEALAGDPIETDARFGGPTAPTGGTTMAQGPRGILDTGDASPEAIGILSEPFWRGNFLMNLGAGILAANRPGTPLGSAVGQGLQLASERHGAQAQNEVIRQRLLDAGRQRRAIDELREIFQDDPTVTGADPRIRGLLLDIDPGAAIDALTPPKPTGLESKLGTVTGALGRDLTEQEILGLAGGGTTINIGDAKADEPLSISDLNRVRLPDGTPVPIGTSAREARELGAKVISADELKRMDDTDRALNVLGELEGLSVGEQGIFQGIGSDVLSRGIAAANFLLGDLVEQDPKVSQFKGLSAGTLGSLIRSLGEAGALSDGDVKRAGELLPQTFPLADSEDAAKSKLSTLRRILTRGVRNLKRLDRGDDINVDGGGDSNVDFRFDPATGNLIPVD